MNGEPWRGWIEKPSRAVKAKRDARDKASQWAKVKRAVMARDGHKCRCCGSTFQVDPHHIKFRSAGGKDTVENLVALCRVCHDDLHGYQLAIVGSNANGKLRFIRRGNGNLP